MSRLNFDMVEVHIRGEAAAHLTMRQHRRLRAAAEQLVRDQLVDDVEHAINAHVDHEPLEDRLDELLDVDD